jgi:hypothetical protein
MEKEKAKAPSRAEIEEFLEREEQRKNLNRERANAPLKEKFKAYAAAEGGKEKSVDRCGYTIALKTKNGQIAWKSEFIRVAGPEEAARVSANPPQVEFLAIEKA